jgi:hypothetical protein
VRPLEKTRCQFELDHSQGRDFPEGMFLNDQFDQRVRELGFSNRGVNNILAVKDDWALSSKRRAPRTLRQNGLEGIGVR